MRKIAIFGFMALAATLLTVAPVSANGSHFTVRVLGNGTLLVTGDNGGNSVAACQIDDDSWLVGEFVGVPGIEDPDPPPPPPPDEVVAIAQYDGVTTDVRFNMRGGDDNVVIDCELQGFPQAPEPFAEGLGGHGLSAPRDVIVLGGNGSDYVSLYEFAVDDDVNVQLGSGDEDIVRIYELYVADDMLIRGQGGDDVVDVRYTNVGDRADINTSSGNSQVDVYNVHFGRSNFKGGSSADHITATAGNGTNTTLGFKPRFSTGNGDDFVQLGGSALGVGGGGFVLVSDRLFINTGSGADDAEIHVHDEDGEGRDGLSYNINMVAGDDTLEIAHDVLAGDLINCGGGTDEFHLFGADQGATIRNCEDIFGGAP